MAEALATVTPVLPRPGARDRPDQRELRTAWYQHAFNPARPAVPGSALAPDARTVPLPAGLTMLPLTGEPARRPGHPGSERQIRPGWMLRERIAELARRISAGRRARYVLGEAFGGPDAQKQSPGRTAR